VEPTPTPDWEAIATQMEELPDSETWTESSPDGKWTADGRTKTETGIIVDEQEQYYAQLTVVSADQSVEWVLVEEISPFGLGYTSPEQVYWSPEGRYLYYTNRPHVDGCGLFVTASDLWRVDLADGTVSQILPSGAQSYAFSPDGSQVAYITWSSPAELVLHDLTTGSERRGTLDFEDAGAMVWSPEGTWIALTGANNPCQPEWRQAIVLVNASDLSQRTLVPPDERLLKTSAWQETGKILLEDLEGNLWWLQVESGEVTLIQ
jgi:Tol biopolymer transport system component